MEICAPHKAWLGVSKVKELRGREEGGGGWGGGGGGGGEAA